MTLKIHPIRYPTAFAYLSSLPAGLLSYPEMRSSSQLALDTRKRWPDLHRRDDLPADVQAALGAPWPAGSWVSEVAFMLQTALVRDVIYRNDEAYLRFCYEATADNLSGLTARALLFFASPKMTILGCRRHWSSLKVGSELTSIGGGKSDHELGLRYPAGAYIGCMLQGFGQSFLAAIAASGATRPQIDVKTVSREECRFYLRWE